MREVNGKDDAAVNGAAPAEHGRATRTLEYGGLRCLVSLPDSEATAERLHPVLCFLHGYDEGPPAELRAGVTRHGPLRPGNPHAAVEGFIHVAPQLPARGDLWHRHADAVREIVASVQREHGGDPRRTYLTGFSFGGNGVFDLGISLPGLWAALWAVDPTRVPVVDPGLPIWLSVGEVARSRKAAFIQALGLEPYTGGATSDRLFLDENADHVGSASRAYADSRIYAWLLSKELRR